MAAGERCGASAAPSTLRMKPGWDAEPAQCCMPELTWLPQHQEEDEEETRLQTAGWSPRFSETAGYGAVELISSRHQKSCYCLHRHSRIHSEVIDFK